MKKYYLLISFLIPVCAFACDCPIYDFDIQIKSSPVIFTGIVEKKEAESKTVHFTALKFFKGINHKKVSLHMKNSLCDYQFEEGKTYLVYTTELESDYATICGRTSPIEKASGDLEKLNSAKAK